MQLNLQNFSISSIMNRIYNLKDIERHEVLQKNTKKKVTLTNGDVVYFANIEGNIYSMRHDSKNYLPINLLVKYNKLLFIEENLHLNILRQDIKEKVYVIKNPGIANEEYIIILAYEVE